MPPWVTEYIGIPFLSHGRDREGIDCYGLVKLVMAEQFGKHLPDFSYIDAFDHMVTKEIMSENRPLLAGIEVKEPSVGDIAVIKYRNLPCHLGIYVGERNILHIEIGTDSILQRVDDPRLCRRIEGFYHVD